MAYEKMGLKDGATLRAAHLDHIEDYLATVREDFFISYDEDTHTVDKTGAQIREAYENGCRMYLHWDGRNIVPLWSSAEGDGELSLFFVKNYGLNFYRVLLSVDQVNKVTVLVGAHDTMDAAYIGALPDTTTSLPNPYALTINGTKYDGSRSVNLTISGGSGSSSTADNTPDYVKAEADRVAQIVQSRQNANTITFVVCSDLHYSSVCSTAYEQTAAMTHMGQAMGLIRKKVHIDFAAVLGDLTWDGDETAEQALRDVRFVNSCLHDGFVAIPNFRARGNHDCGYGCKAYFTDSQIFANIGSFNSGAVYDPSNRIGGYCYRDFEDQKIRVICLNSSEHSSGDSQLTPAQVTWLASALDLSSKGAGWRSIILSHHPLDWGKAGGSNPISTINSATGLICTFHGHIHNFKVDKIAGTSVPRIAIPNGCNGRENEYTTSYGITWGEDTKYPKTANSATDTAFCVVTLDMAAEKIYVDHYGAGRTRILNFDGSSVGSYAVTTTLSHVIANAPSEVPAGDTCIITVTAVSGYTLDGGTVKVTMGGADISSTYANGKITIDKVTGPIVITATAVVDETPGDEEDTVPYRNWVKEAIDTNGALYDGRGYKTGYRLNSSGTESSLATAICSGYIPYDGEVIRAHGCSVATVGSTGNYLALYDSAFAKTLTIAFNNLVDRGATYDRQADGKYMLTVDPTAVTDAAYREYFSGAAYIRCSFAEYVSTSDFIITLNEEIL